MRGPDGSEARPGTEGFNQPPDLCPYNAYTSDMALQDAVVWAGLGADDSRLIRYGAIAGDELYRLGFAAKARRSANTGCANARFRWLMKRRSVWVATAMSRIFCSPGCIARRR